jgi:hypothetical protein
VRLGPGRTVEGQVLAPVPGHNYALVTEENQPRCLR